MAFDLAPVEFSPLFGDQSKWATPAPFMAPRAQGTNWLQAGLLNQQPSAPAIDPGIASLLSPQGQQLLNGLLSPGGGGGDQGLGSNQGSFGMDGPAGSGSWGAMLGLLGNPGITMARGLASELGLDLGMFGLDMGLAPTPFSGGFQSANAAQGPQGYGVPGPTTADPQTWGGNWAGWGGGFGDAPGMAYGGGTPTWGGDGPFSGR